MMGMLIQVLFALAALAAIGTVFTSIAPNLSRIIAVLRGEAVTTTCVSIDLPAAPRRLNRRRTQSSRMRRGTHNARAA